MCGAPRILRTVYREIGDVPHQIINRRRIAGASAPPEVRRRVAASGREQRAGYVFDLETDWPIGRLLNDFGTGTCLCW